MLSVLLIWLIISLVLYVSGDIFLRIYNYTCKRNEAYSLLNTILIGIPFLSIILMLISFFLPISTNISILLYLFSFLYLLVTRKWHIFYQTIKYRIKLYTIVELIFLSISALVFIFIVTWALPNFDSTYYHHQSQRWIEDYPLVKGIANLEERFGFNSIYFILNSPFTFRFLHGEAQFCIQSLLAVFIFLWIFDKLVRSDYDLKYCILLFIYIIFISVNLIGLSDSSTDVSSNLIAFYLIVRAILIPDLLKKDALLYISVLPFLAAIKLSMAFISLICIFPLIQLARDKELKAILFLLLFVLLMMSLWILRNAFISGYLIYPFYQLDILNVDWKLPKDVAIAENKYISGGARWQLRYTIESVRLLFKGYGSISLVKIYIISILHFLTLISPLPFLLMIIKKRISEIKQLVPIYLILVICFILGMMVGPDFRFISAIFMSIIFISAVVWIIFFKKSVLLLKYKKIIMVIIFSFFLSNVVIWIIHNYIPESFDLKSYTKIMLLRPRNYKEKMTDPENQLRFDKYKLNNGIEIYVTCPPYVETFDKLPCVPFDDDAHNSWRFQKNTSIEARGKTIRDGFRSKESM